MLKITSALVLGLFLLHTPPTQDGAEAPLLWVRAAMIYEGMEVNDNIIELPALMNAASSFEGKPVLKGHDWGDPDKCVGLIKTVKVKLDGLRDHYYLEAIFAIEDPVAVEKIKKGLYRLLSIGFMINEDACNICEIPMRRCGHRPGWWNYEDGKYIEYKRIIKKFRGLECSFINVPACEYAMVLEFSVSPLK